MNLRMRIGIFTSIFFFLAIVLFSQQQETKASNSNDDNSYRMLSLLGEAFERVRNSYVEDVDDEVLIEAAIQGMMSALDPYSTYLDQKHFNDMQERTSGQFGGLGLEVTMDETGFIRVISPLDDTPAAKAGLMPGDLITHIDDNDISTLNLTQAVEKMRGAVDTSINLKVVRDLSERLDFTLIRKVIQIRSVRSRIEHDDIGYIRITGFNINTGSSIEDALEKLLKKTPQTKGFILDLRNNPGGLLDEAIRISDGFLERGEIVSIRGRNNSGIQRFHARAGDWAQGKPIAVLINGGSASASEIVGGALQDHGRATLIGTSSFGKGSVQTIIPLQTAKAAIKLTTQYYYTPSGRSIAKTGLSPDIEIASLPPIKNDDGTLSPPKKDIQLNRAIEFIKDSIT